MRHVVLNLVASLRPPKKYIECCPAPMQSQSSAVFLAKQADYEQLSLDTTVASLLGTLLADAGTLRSAKVVLKPNLITKKNGTLACTDARFLEAVARCLVERGAQVAVGDSPAFGSAQSVLAAINALPALRRLGIPVLEFRESRTVLLPSGQHAALATAALDCDLLLNLPRVKAHAQMRVTLAIKNLFGCLVGWHKPWWHMAHGGEQGCFAELLVELLAALPRTYTLVDGIVAMHRSGPIHGEPYPLGLLAGGSNPVAIDTALLVLLGIDPHQSPLWCAARRAGLSGSRVDELVFPWASLASVSVHDFVVPHNLDPIRFHPFRFTKNSLKRIFQRILGH
jgi:uncharacterized protein (DUF362 family)